MFLKLEEKLYINTDSIIGIEIIDKSDLPVEKGEEVEEGFVVSLITNSIEDMMVMKHECDDKKNCEIEKEISVSHKMYFNPESFETLSDAENWIVMNIPNVQAINVHKLN